MTLVFATRLLMTGWRYDVQDNDTQRYVACAGGFRSEAEAQLEAFAYIERATRETLEANGHIVGPRCGDLTAVDGVWRRTEYLDRLAAQYSPLIGGNRRG